MAGMPPYDPYYGAGYASPPGYAPVPGFAPPVTDRPPKEQCFYIKNNMSKLIMGVENSGVDPGTRIVMESLSGQGKDSELWFEDYQTGTIKSRLNLLCLDIQDIQQPHQVIKSPQNIPPNVVCHTTPGPKTFYSAVAHTQWGSIPGRALTNQCWYTYGGAEYCTADFSWIIAQNTRLIQNTGSPPAGAIAAGHQSDDGCVYYAAIAKSKWGMLPGKAKDNTCWYGHDGTEHHTSDFHWIITETNIGVLNPYTPGKVTQLWLRAGDKLQNRQDGAKVIQAYTQHKSSLIFSTVVTNDMKQKWTFVNYGTPGLTASPLKLKFSPPSYEQVSPTLKFGKLSITRYFFIQSDMHSKVIDVSGESKQPGTMAIMWLKKSPPANNQLWYLDDDGIIRSKLTDFCLQPSGHGIWLQPYTKQPNQMWIPNGKKIVLRNNPNMCLDIVASDKKDGAKLCQFKYKASPNQHWTLVYIN